MKKLSILVVLFVALTLSACTKSYSGAYDYKIFDLSAYEVETGYAIAFPQGSTLKTGFDTVIKNMMDDGTLACFNSYYSDGDDCFDSIDFSNKVYNLSYNGNGEVLDVITSSGYEPFEMLDDNLNLIGYDIDLANFIAKELNYKLNWIDGKFDQIIANLTTNKVDFAIAAITPTPERKESVDFSMNYYSESQTVVLFRSEDGFTSLEDLKGLTIAAQEGTVQADLIEQLKADGIVKQAIYVDYPATAMQQLKTNKIDALFIEQSIAEELLLTFNK